MVRAVKSARAAEPNLDEEELLALAATNTGVPVRMVRTALSYWARFPQDRSFTGAVVTALDRLLNEESFRLDVVTFLQR
jgi:hypothetical protein